MYLIIPWRDDAELEVHQDQILQMICRHRSLDRARETCQTIGRLGWSADIVNLDDPAGRAETWSPGPGGPRLTTTALDA